ncbi:inositol-3-phosphate synthase [Desulforhabdus amnigena]|uniref:Myo-inositol-1-phosphate synthase n=1 Tax=Desulforhabdus amnigena TaxID=40218 RepID=A0A9W6FSH3_9BACT|nr:inositol-3-phosphate synthase [Desulforhabdus amnigena]NLJ27201.1 inositol-3-phosphate synthase [Deltaproteobacteria bacterium]GLI34053.1 myo-inositol-1-phosphate synthase [Desulforhabdus amnigena]
MLKEKNLKLKEQITAPTGKLGVLIPGIGGAVSTTFIAGVELVRKGLASPIGSLTQLGTIRLGKRFERRSPRIKDFVPLASLDDLVFGGWDLYEANGYEAAMFARVLKREHIEPIKDFLRGITPMKAVFDRRFVKNLDGKYIKEENNLRAQVEALKEDIRRFKDQNGCERCIMIWCGSTEVYLQCEEIHQSVEALQKAIDANDSRIPPSMLYAVAAMESGIPFINGAPNLTVDVPAMVEMASQNNLPIAGKDFKTGQTLMKTILAPGLKSRMLGLEGWYSTNILGNRDGLVLDDKDSFKTKEESKLSVLEYILQPQLYPSLYKNYYHKVTINYYPPRGDNKEGWDCIDIFGWLGYPMQIKVDFQCRDSILAAPLVLDLVLFMDLAQRVGLSGIQEWLSFYFKSPMHKENLYPEHDLFIQSMKLKNTLRYLMGEDQITHFGLDYYMKDDENEEK